jgi:Zn-dependent protease
MAMNDTLLTALAMIPALVLAIVFHEVAHGWAALMLGDPTAKERRRLSLNPLRHVDPLGTVILPGLLALTGAPVFGWAKPVPVNKWRLNNPRFGMMAVAAAGPGTNLVLAAVGAMLLGLFIRGIAPDASGSAELMNWLMQSASIVPTSGAGFVLLTLFSFILINLFLALFNLIPLPPFDGSHIVEGLLPPTLARAYEKLRPFGFPLLFILLLVVPYFFPEWGMVQRFVLPPVLWVLDKYLHLATFFAG